MASKADIKIRLDFWRAALAKMQTAYLALIDGGVKSYVIDDRELTRFDIPDLLDKIKEAEDKIDELEALMRGQKARRAFSTVPRDW